MRPWLTSAIAACCLLLPAPARSAEPLPAGIGTAMVNASAAYRDASNATLRVLDSYFIADDRSTPFEIGDEMGDLCAAIRDKLLKLSQTMLIELGAETPEATAMRTWKEQQETLWSDTCSYGVALAQLRGEMAQTSRELAADTVTIAKLHEEMRKRIITVKDWLVLAKKVKDWSEGPEGIDGAPDDRQVDDVIKDLADFADDVLPLSQTLAKLLVGKSEQFKSRLRKLTELNFSKRVGDRLDHPPKSYETARVFQDHWKLWRDGIKRDRERYVTLWRKYEEVTKSWREEKLLEQTAGLAYINYLYMQAAVRVEYERLLLLAIRLQH
jgi:hypothetical protein